MPIPPRFRPGPSLALAFALALAVLLPGCADLVGHAPSAVARCQASTVILFREDATSGNLSRPVPVPQSFATLLGGGLWTRVDFTVSALNGTGNWSAPEGVLRNVSLEQAKTEFERGVSQTKRDVNVTFAVRRDLAADEYAAFCAALVNVYPNLPTTDVNRSCADGETAIYRVWLDGVQRQRSSYCGGNADSTHAFEAALRAVKANDTR